jgi:hypothetical protein
MPSTDAWWSLKGPPIAALQPVDEVQLPERAGVIERLRDDLRDLLGELAVAARRGQCHVPHVVIDVENGIVDPVRVVEPKRDAEELPAQGRREMDTPGHEVSQDLPVTGASPSAGGARIDSDPTWSVCRSFSAARMNASVIDS